MFPNAPISQLLIRLPTPPPNGNSLLEKIKASETDKTSNPIVTYFRLRQIEKTFRLKRRLVPTTKKKVQIRSEAIPKPL